jgi:enamine deaminase RidA (YjgF/YER057c/UK114 family)
MNTHQTLDDSPRVNGAPGPFRLLSIAPTADPLDAAHAFETLAAYAAQQGIRPLLERVFAPGDLAATLPEIRATAYRAHGLDSDAPVTWISNAAPKGRGLAGVQMLGLVPGDDWTVRATPGSSTRHAHSSELDLLAAGDLRGPQSAPRLALDGMFGAATSALERHGFEFRDVVRTWLYADDLLGVYNQLNESRDALFTAQGLIHGPSWQPPASTGIQGHQRPSVPCFMELLALRRTGGGRAARTLRPKTQCEAWDYGSSFSRGMLVDLGRQTLVTISGTASINEAGSSTHEDDPVQQILATVRSIEDLLGREGSSLDAAAWTTLYVKDERTWGAWMDLRAQGRVPELRGPTVIADICRDELLVEIEATALTRAS